MMQGGRIGKGKFPGCACEKPCRRHVRKVQVSAYAETLLPLPGSGVSPASVSEYPKGYPETLLAGFIGTF